MVVLLDLHPHKLYIVLAANAILMEGVMSKIQADLLPRIAKKWGQESSFYQKPFCGRESKWVKTQQELFRQMNPINACQNPNKITPYNTRLYFNQKDLTGFGGIFLPLAFAERLGFDTELEDVLEHDGHKYTTTELLFSSLAAIILGVPRLYDVNIIRFDKGLTKAIGVESLPEEGNIRKQLRRAQPHHVEALERVLRHGLAQSNQTEDEIDVGLDIDLTTATVYGKQEGAEPGYNPQKKGRRCYQIATAFLMNNGDGVKMELREGNTTCTTDFEKFFEAAVAQLPPNYRVALTRLDKGFFGDATFNCLEGRKVYYVAAAKATQPLKLLAKSLSYSRIPNTDKLTYITEIGYRYGTWKKFRRLIVVKEQVPNPDHNPEETDLFGEPLQPRYLDKYRFYVTNIPVDRLEAVDCWSFYNERGTVENRIKESKLGFHLDKLPSTNQQGNAFYAQLVLLAYNLLNWFKRFVVPPEFRTKSIRWIRMNLLILPALVVRKKNQWFIKFSVHYAYADLMRHIFRRLSEGKPYYVV